jgi:hypothetical protein
VKTKWSLVKLTSALNMPPMLLARTFQQFVTTAVEKDKFNNNYEAITDQLYRFQKLHTCWLKIAFLFQAGVFYTSDRQKLEKNRI